MATNRDLLTEAIADAKSVKEVAIANAKLALEEAFTPHLKSMLAAKLDEMDKEDEVKEDVVDEKMDSKDKEKVDEKKDKEDLDEMDAVSFRRKNSPSYEMDADGGPVNPVPHKVGKSTVQEEKEEMDEELNLDELLAELDELDEAKKHDSKKGNKEEQKRMEGAIRDDRDHIKDLEGDIKDNEKKLAKLKADEKKDVNESVEDLDEAKHKDDEKMDEAKKAEDKEDVKEDARTDAEEEGYLDGMKDEKEDMDDREIDLDDMSEDDLKGFIEDVIKDMVIDGEIEPGDEFVEDEVEVEDVEDVEVEDDVDVDVEISEEKDEDVKEGYGKKYEEDDVKKEEMSNPVQRRGDSERRKGGKFSAESEPERETEKMRKMEEDLEAAINSVNELKAELNEVNLLNAKLLYTNKIFKAKNLTEGKKVKVLKAFDKAKDVRQAKTIFETLSEGLLDKSPVNESIKGSASKATGLEPKASKQPIIESNDVYNRMRKLAGLI